MRKLIWLAAASAALAAGCAGGGAETASGSTTRADAPSAAAPSGTFTDDQLRAYLAAKAEIDPIQARYEAMTEAQRAEARSEIGAIMQRHGLTAVVYDAIARQARDDPTFANRLTGLQPGTFTDANLRAFAAASIEIEPINRALPTASAEQRAQATEQIRAILARHNLDGATYNAIAARAQSDPAFAARIRALYEQAATPNG